MDKRNLASGEEEIGQCRRKMCSVEGLYLSSTVVGVQVDTCNIIRTPNSYVCQKLVRHAFIHAL